MPIPYHYGAAIAVIVDSPFPTFKKKPRKPKRRKPYRPRFVAPHRMVRTNR